MLFNDIAYVGNHDLFILSALKSARRQPQGTPHKNSKNPHHVQNSGKKIYNAILKILM